MRIQEVKDDISFIQSFSTLAKTLEEVSLLKMQEVRNYVLNSRLFHDGLASVYRDIKITDAKEFRLVNPRKKKKENKQPKKVAVLLSANSRLYGTIIDEVYEKFNDYLQSHEDDLVIIGKIGKDLYETAGNQKKYTYFELKDANIIYMDLLSILGHILEYDEIKVFYGKYSNIFTHHAQEATISGEVAFEFTDADAKKEDGELFLLEPSAEELESFFTGQIIGLLFRQAAYEFELARHSSRIQILDQALQHTDDEKKKRMRLLRQIKINEENKKQVNKATYFLKKRSTIL